LPAEISARFMLCASFVSVSPGSSWSSPIWDSSVTVAVANLGIVGWIGRQLRVGWGRASLFLGLVLPLRRLLLLPGSGLGLIVHEAIVADRVRAGRMEVLPTL
jgi:hypothetical protein